MAAFYSRGRALLAMWSCSTLFSIARLSVTMAGDVRMASWNIPDLLDSEGVMSKVALLTVTRSDASSPWCMGLLVAPDALLAYAHCVGDKNISWAFFGDSLESFHGNGRGEPEEEKQEEVNAEDDQATSDGSVMASAGSLSSGAAAAESLDFSSVNVTQLRSFLRVRSEDDADVGDVQEWVPTIETILHPDYGSTNKSPAADMAIVRLQVARDVAPFQLLPDEQATVNSTKVATTNTFRGYKVTNEFVQNASFAKSREIGPFSRVSWYNCPWWQRTVNGAKLPLKAPSDQMCLIASAIEDRVKLDAINSFVMIGDQLAGLSVCHSSDCVKRVVHPYVLVSGLRDFIEHATRKQDIWTDMGLFVIGGSDAVLQGYLSGLRMTKSGQNFCLGSLIAPEFVLTAAHCVEDVMPRYASVGSRYSSSEDDGEQIKVKNVVVHPKYDPKTLRYDFAIVELQFISIQTPLLLDNESDEDLYKTERLTLYGYGETSATSEKQLIQSLALPLVSNTVCNSIVGDPVVDATMVCAGGDAGRDGCKGDSGAPLVQESNGADQQYLVALSSFGWGCGIAGVPAVYAKVSAAADFIDKHVPRHTWRYSVEPSKDPGKQDDDDAPSTRTPSPDRPDSGPNSPPMSPSEEERSGEGGASGEHDRTDRLDLLIEASISEIAQREDLTRTTSIPLEGLQSIVIATTTSQFTRDTIATTILVNNDQVANEDVQDATMVSSAWASESASSDPQFYSCAGAIAMYSSADLSGVETMLSGFEDRPLRKRGARFARSPGVVRLPQE